MTSMQEAMWSLHCWFAEKNIPIDGLTVILNFRDAEPAAQLDYNLKKELIEFMMQPTQTGTLDLRNFSLTGLQMKIESPLHPID